MSRHVDADALLAALYEADAITPRGAKIIREFPVAEAVEEKPGRWKEYDDGENTWYCSSCGEPWVFIEGNPSQNGMSYCPSCGAKMNGVQDK